MQVFTLTSLALLTSILVACSSAPTKSLLEERAGYDHARPPFGMNGDPKGSHYVPTRVPEKVVVAWLHAHELPSQDYFWGSWLSIVVEPEGWEMIKADAPESAQIKESPRPKGIPRTAKKSKTEVKNGNQ